MARDRNRAADLQKDEKDRNRGSDLICRCPAVWRTAPEACGIQDASMSDRSGVCTAG